MHDGYRPLDPPAFWLRIFERRPEAAGEDEPTEEEVHLDRGGDLAPAPVDVRP